ncbi:MAG TPA: hypothetical protein PK624_12705 [Spirochaetota bacterium]|nr:hypothetical protein [Spirochaetota bacterium]HOR45645.1 hypothetical protein [Spirochaetota bacterium]HPK57308.1 hypothetical protein [Spirochaetota bacterium]
MNFHQIIIFISIMFFGVLHANNSDLEKFIKKKQTELKSNAWTYQINEENYVKKVEFYFLENSELMYYTEYHIRNDEEIYVRDIIYYDSNKINKIYTKDKNTGFIIVKYGKDGRKLYEVNDKFPEKKDVMQKIAEYFKNKKNDYHIPIEYLIQDISVVRFFDSKSKLIREEYVSSKGYDSVFITKEFDNGKVKRIVENYKTGNIDRDGSLDDFE